MPDDKSVELDAKTLKFFCAEFRKFVDGIEAMIPEEKEEVKPPVVPEKKPVFSF